MSLHQDAETQPLEDDTRDDTQPLEDEAGNNHLCLASERMTHVSDGSSLAEKKNARTKKHKKLRLALVM